MARKNDLCDVIGLPPLPSQSRDALSTLVWVRRALKDHLKKSYAVSHERGIEELKSVKIGGVDQWLHIRSRNKANPILLFLHGGPASGGGWIGCMDAVQRPWEDYFTVVQWDQLGTGKSAGKTSEKSNISVEGLINDAEEVATYLCRYLNKNKLFICGHSWGSVTGMHLVKRCPELIFAYVGVAQVVNSVKGEKLLYQRLLDHAIQLGETSLVKTLKSMQPYPDPESLGTSYAENHLYVRKELCRVAGEAMTYDWSFDDALKILAIDQLISPHNSLLDIRRSLITAVPPLTQAPYKLASEVMAVDLPSDIGSKFEVPIFFFTGAHDWHTPKLLSDEWLEQIDSPYKKVINFQESCHMVVNEQPGKMLINLVTEVLPFARDRYSRES